MARSRNRSSVAFVLSLFLGGAVFTSACGGKKPPVTPTNTTGTVEPVVAGQPLAGDGGAQSGQSDAPSDGSTDERPKMNASAKSAYDRGMALWTGGDLVGAKGAFQEATTADANAYQAFFSLGVIQERLADDGALTSYRQAYTVVPSYEPAIVAYGLLLAKKNNLSEADDFLTDKKSRMPKSAAVLAALAEVKSLKKDTGSAQQLAQDALKLNPKYAPAMVVLARDHYRNRRLDLALYALQAILDSKDPANPPRDPQNAEAHLLRAQIYKEQGKRQPALEEFKKAVDLRPDFVGARVQLAAYYLESGNAADALPHLDAALKYNKENLQAHLNRGDALRLQGDIEGAKKEFEWVTAHDASVPQVYYSFALLYLFAPSIQGMDQKQQMGNAIASLEKFQQLRGKPTPGSSDDSDQLLTRAKTKLESMNAADQATAAAAAASASAATAAAAAPPASAAPAASGAPAAAGSAAPPP